MKNIFRFLSFISLTFVFITLTSCALSQRKIKSTTGTTYYYKNDNALCLDVGRQPLSSKKGQRYFLLTTKKCTLNGYKIDLAGKKSAYSLRKTCQLNDNSIACSAARDLGLYKESDLRVVYMADKLRTNTNTFLSLSSGPTCDAECERKEKLEEQEKINKANNRSYYWNKALDYLKRDNIKLACQNWLYASRNDDRDAEINFINYKCKNF
tara:strand:+ start:76 stop:705 length:630 start_codon:yes stop_codon:yes gene_type:complete